MPLFLIRHGNAGVRDNLDLTDGQRPLDGLGRDHAAAIAKRLSAEPIEAIFSSPALRCQQTVAPLATSLGLTIEITSELFEGASSSSSIAFIRSLTNRTAVLCSHGDVIPDVLRNLEVGGSRVDGRGCAKGSIWQLDNGTERIESAVYLGSAEMLT